MRSQEQYNLLSFDSKVAGLSSGLARWGINRVINAPTPKKAFDRASKAMRLLKYMIAAKRVAPEAKSNMWNISTHLTDPQASLE